MHLPKTNQEMNEKISEFENQIWNDLGFGCIDGSHIFIGCPPEHSDDYFCYKQFYSLSVQALCDYKGPFMDVECKWPGRVHYSDVKVFANASVCKRLHSSDLPTIF